jgi:hypothetical protein
MVVSGYKGTETKTERAKGMKVKVESDARGEVVEFRRSETVWASGRDVMVARQRPFPGPAGRSLDQLRSCQCPGRRRFAA